MIDFELDYLTHNNPVARIKVIGVGGAGGNTVNHMIKAKYESVEFIVVNTDVQALKASQAPFKLQIGSKSTRGLGAGANPEIGKNAAEEDIEKISEFLKDADMIFITGGLGGGTGSGAMPVIARAAREMGVLCVAVVTKPFLFEGKRRKVISEDALMQLKKEIDTLIVIPNQKLLDVADHKVSLVDAFALINDVLHQFVKSIADIISRPGHVNVDFADVSTIMKNMGIAVMGTGSASGVDRAQKAALQAISSPLLENTNIRGAQAILLNITGSSKLGLHEVHSAASIIYEAAEDANIIMGSVIDDTMGDEVLVTVIATGIDKMHQTQVIQKTEETTESSPLGLRPAQFNTNATKINQANSIERSNNLSSSSFESLSEIDSQDLEVPTFLRRMKEKEMQQK